MASRKKLFVVAIDQDAKTEQRDEFTTWLRGQGAGFWHHISHTWLVVDAKNVLTTAMLRDKARVLMPEGTLIIMQVTPVEWNGFAPLASHAWLKKNLDDPELHK